MSKTRRERTNSFESVKHHGLSSLNKAEKTFSHLCRQSKPLAALQHDNQPMTLTPELKATIDGKSIYALLHGVRFSPAGSEMFQGESGDYWIKRLNELRDLDNDAFVRASKDMGWER